MTKLALTESFVCYWCWASTCRAEQLHRYYSKFAEDQTVVFHD